MAKAQHRTPEHRRARVNLGRLIEQGKGWCVQGEQGTGSSGTCLMPTRFIAPGQAWDVAHNDAGTRIIGPAHQTCNRTEGSQRGNPRAGATPPPRTRWAL